MSSTLKVNGLTYRTIEKDVERIFNKRSKIDEVFIPKDKVSGKSKGFAFVRFFNKEDAKDAYVDQNGSIHDGRRINIEWSHKDDGKERRAEKARRRSRRSRSITPPVAIEWARKDDGHRRRVAKGGKRKSRSSSKTPPLTIKCSFKVRVGKGRRRRSRFRSPPRRRSRSGGRRSRSRSFRRDRGGGHRSDSRDSRKSDQSPLPERRRSPRQEPDSGFKSRSRSVDSVDSIDIDIDALRQRIHLEFEGMSSR